ncbi:hypothetical protein PAXRUDRAFT_832383 [Paxillus rubicundulus Ve08.2h10]|uniref:Unplaced genomic scaffold scaffold_850, whole genome shotgun sequence n=1 Tax=Paxillus rubicundulus Ve08.2h10 TaxID=930991 RepID=A0A0D0DR90_9AGAM|nr:hypothetical protein PAXRUDRAFT_832383 [Paxillus rubicundulus Ve08.2h10]
MIATPYIPEGGRIRSTLEWERELMRSADVVLERVWDSFKPQVVPELAEAGNFARSNNLGSPRAVSQGQVRQGTCEEDSYQYRTHNVGSKGLQFDVINQCVCAILCLFPYAPADPRRNSHASMHSCEESCPSRTSSCPFLGPCP